jgi:LPS-assembly lipoprotein
MLLKKLFLAVLIMLNTGCGYHLGGKVDLPPEMKIVYFQGASPFLLGGATQVFRSTEGKIAGSPAEAGIIINVFNEEMLRRSLSLDSGGRAIEYEFSYHLNFELLDGAGQVLMPRQELQVIRDYFNVQVQVIGKANEEAIIREEMYQEAVQIIVRRARVTFNSAEK